AQSRPAAAAAPAAPRAMPKKKKQAVRPPAPAQQAAPARPAAAARPSGKVQIKERQDASRVMLWVIVLAAILGAGAFLAWKFNLV
ncbi:MAG: hypothetical protein AAGD14_18400, partial [Planctomycetota bacterium]